MLFPAIHTLGNVGIVPLKSVLADDQVRRALEAVRLWVYERALSLNPGTKSSWYFLDSFTEMLNLSFWLNKSWTRDMIWRTPCLSYARFRSIPGVSEGTFYSPYHLVRAMEMSQPHSLAHGVAFLRSVLSNFLSIGGVDAFRQFHACTV